jgi:hypothetical protein
VGAALERSRGGAPGEAVPARDAATAESAPRAMAAVDGE